ncbi:type II secretion system protein GspM [Rossellomorea vietnamensis]|uniref:type II secretion system protein GspM n=1 Tax=Rossellomorea vietnamensis TaxID=218284 RepID=UPI003D27C3EB
MISSLTKKERLLLIASAFVCLFSLFLFYYFVYSPQQDRLEMKQKELKAEQQILSAVEAKTEQIETHSYKDIHTLQNQIPVEPLTEQIILQLEKAEVLSQSEIQSITFAKEDFAYSSEESDDTLEGDSQGSSNPQESGNDHSGVKRLQMTMTVQSENYFEMEEFIHELENLPRVVEVNQLLIQGREEMSPVLSEKGPEPLIFQLVASAFYIPGLSDLQDGLPSIDTPAPLLKKNPFIQYTDPSSEEETAERQADTAFPDN